MLESKSTFMFLVIFAGVSVFFSQKNLSAHCDGLDGPVVKAAQKALETGNVNLVLIWVQKQDEAEIKQTFEQTLTVRKLGPQALELADRYFFETLVRIHRAGEGAPYTGLKPAGRDLGPAIPAADKAVEEGAVEPILKLVTDAVQHGIHKQFKQIMHTKNFSADDVEGGREFVKDYVIFVHYVNGIYNAAAGSAGGHSTETTATEGHKE